MTTKTILAVAFIAAAVPFGSSASDFELVEQCFVELHGQKETVQKLEMGLAKAEAELRQMKNDHPDITDDSTVNTGAGVKVTVGNGVRIAGIVLTAYLLVHDKGMPWGLL